MDNSDDQIRGDFIVNAQIGYAEAVDATTVRVSNPESAHPTIHNNAVLGPAGRGLAGSTTHVGIYRRAPG